MLQSNSKTALQLVGVRCLEANYVCVSDFINLLVYNFIYILYVYMCALFSFFISGKVMSSDPGYFTKFNNLHNVYFSFGILSTYLVFIFKKGLPYVRVAVCFYAAFQRIMLIFND